mmetsp:Transcript_2833/g.9467  ORF Transcript_2833/g.9467 Transcript_2833/m.9467 type:complete len:204 (+) Transcript_2833:618-1229(+)
MAQGLVLHGLEGHVNGRQVRHQIPNVLSAAVRQDNVVFGVGDEPLSVVGFPISQDAMVREDPVDSEAQLGQQLRQRSPRLLYSTSDILDGFLAIHQVLYGARLVVDVGQASQLHAEDEVLELRQLDRGPVLRRPTLCHVQRLPSLLCRRRRRCRSNCSGVVKGVFWSGGVCDLPRKGNCQTVSGGRGEGPRDSSQISPLQKLL